jgi:hypothetical protein
MAAVLGEEKRGGPLDGDVKGVPVRVEHNDASLLKED